MVIPTLREVDGWNFLFLQFILHINLIMLYVIATLLYKVDYNHDNFVYHIVVYKYDNFEFD